MEVFRCKGCFTIFPNSKGLSNHLHWHWQCTDDENGVGHLIYDVANEDHATVVNTEEAALSNGNDDIDVENIDAEYEDYNEQTTNNNDNPFLDAAMAKNYDTIE